MAAIPSDMADATHPFSATEVEMLRRIANAVIPPSDEFDVPGAGDPAIFARILARCAASERAIREALGTLGGSAAGSPPPAAVGDAEFAECLRGFPAKQPAFAGLMSWIVAASYYQDPRVLRSIGSEPRPPFPQGHSVPPSDWSLLEPVKRRGQMFRDVPDGS
jgi:hypothetical protein